ncbi:hypothetical protein LWI29_007692 [Acer saccharum]|uniref:RNase H type-1 domain-containing protein n=1 Tax=Acer saccharum TaxID=4024 RepID=A0AA39VQB4_ACESA|nr:hypothetical protein LWI29_007692 [Acer saccharum]
MWRIWFNRNQVVHGMGKQDMAAVVDWSMCYLSDFRAANVAENKDGMSGKIRNVVVRWQPTTEGLYKVNTDASVDSGKHLAGLGLVIRDHLGFVMASSAQCIGACFTPMIMEAVAVLWVLNWLLRRMLLEWSIW